MSKQKKRKRARVQIAVDEQGKPVYKWANGYTKAELEASKTKIRIEYGVDQMIKFPVIKKESPPENKCETFSAYATRWFALYKEPHVRASTKSMYENGFNAHIFPAIGSRPLDEITADELQAFVIGFSESSSSLIDKIMLILRQVFAAAQADGLIEKNPVARLKPPAGTTGERLPLSIKDVEALVKAARIHPYGLFPLLLLFTGLRRGEALGLKWSDLRGNKLHIERAVYYEESNAATIGETKTKASHREIPLVPLLVEKLNEQRAGHGENEFIFGGKRPIAYRTLKRHWEKLQADIVVLAGVTPHRLRHTYLMLLRRAGVDAVTQQYLMGHSDFDTTANTYTHVDALDVSEAEEKMVRNLSDLLPNVLPQARTSSTV